MTNDNSDNAIFLSLQDLATSPSRTNVTTQFELFADYNQGNNDYGNLMIRSALNSADGFTGANTDQTTELVGGILTNVVMYMAVLEKAYSAVALCNNAGGEGEEGEVAGNTDAAVFLLDEAVAFYVGSIEGEEEGGRDGGQLLYAVAKKLCDTFGVCSTGGDASSNVEIMQSFLQISIEITQGECDSAEETLLENIAPGLLVPLIQGTLNYAVVNDGLPQETQEGSLGTGYAFAQSILPLIDVGDLSASQMIGENLQFTLTDAPVPDGAAAVFEAVKSGIQKLTTPLVIGQCDNIGRYGNGAYGDVCDGLSPVTQPPSSTPKPTSPNPILSTPTNSPTLTKPSTPTASPVEAQPTDLAALVALGLGRYNFVHDVTGVAGLALDVQEMQQGTVEDANTTYMNGGNAVIMGTETVVSLAALSRTAGIDMDQDPMFNLFRWALLDEEVLDKISTDDFDVMDSAYADIVVQKALSVAKDNGLAAETAVIMSVWMEICHEIYNAIEYCQDGDDQTVLAIDRAVALWVGTGQTASSFDSGFMMYNIAQRGEKFFGLETGEARANTDIIDSFNEAQNVARKCTADSDDFLNMKIIASDIFKQMTIPLLQNLLYYISEDTENLIELYALAVLPQAIGCGSSDFIGLRDVLVADAVFDAENIDQTFFEEMQRFQKCHRISCADLLGNSNPKGTKLRELIDDVCYDDTKPNKKMAGFEPVNDVYELSRLDLDILQIGIFMETKAYDAAEDYYYNGYNSQGSLRPRSLRELAKSAGRTVVPQFETFKQYFEADYADKTIQAGMNRSGVFLGAYRDQAAEAVTRALQGLVSYMAVLEKLYSAVDQCTDGIGAVQTWEEGVALFVGSLEGSETGGNGAWDGTMLYSLAKETSVSFGTFEGNDDASINQELLEVLVEGRDLLQSDDCDGALEILEDDVLGDLPVSLIQGMLSYAMGNTALEPGDSTYALSTGYVLARSILPLVDAVNTTSAALISTNMNFDLTTQPVSSGLDAVFEAMTWVMVGMGVDCEDIGILDSRKVCNAEVVRPDTETPTNLGNGLYTTTTYVEDRSKIALDVVAIRDALESDSLELAQIIYRDGENSIIYNDNGIKVGQRSLQKFSTENTVDMANEPLFNIYRYALKDENGLYLGKNASLYADSIVNQAFATNNPKAKSLAAEAMLAMNLWMFLAHELFETLGHCKNQVIADTDGVHSIDEAVAYWIGDGQIVGDGENGNLFYALAERMGDKFKMNLNGQSRTNFNILRLFNQAKIELSFPDACTENPNTYPRLRQIVYRILTQMTIPLVQSLIHHLRENDRERVKLYAQAVAPLTAACNPELFEYLNDKVIGGSYNVIEVEDIVERLRTCYDCLGISCDDVGQHVSETDNICVDTPKQNPLAGYVPNADVRDYAQLDLDILEAGILMEMGAYTAVEDLYTYGKHAIVDGISGTVMLSLAQMATTSDRSVVPEFDSFVRYFENNKYADKIIRTALDKSKQTDASDEQRKELVVKSMQYLVVYMGSLQAMYDAISGCESGDGSRFLGAQESWDRAAALLIGSIEGEEDGGDKNGQSFYALAKKRCKQFNTCGPDGFSEVNEELLSLLYTGKGELEAGSCSALKRAVSGIEPLLLIPIIQSTLSYALANSRLDASPTDGDFAEGFVFSRAVLPLVEDVNRDSAEIINRNLDFKFGTKPVPDGSLAVFNAFATAYPGMNIDCNQLGQVEGIDPCTGVQTSSGPGGISGGAIAGIVISIVAVIGLFTYLGMRKRDRKKAEEQAPMFRRSGLGVMNHDSDLLGGRHNDAAVLDGDEAFVHRLQVRADSQSLT